MRRAPAFLLATVLSLLLHWSTLDLLRGKGMGAVSSGQQTAPLQARLREVLPPVVTQADVLVPTREPPPPRVWQAEQRSAGRPSLRQVMTPEVRRVVEPSTLPADEAAGPPAFFSGVAARSKSEGLMAYRMGLIERAGRLPARLSEAVVLQLIVGADGKLDSITVSSAGPPEEAQMVLNWLRNAAAVLQLPPVLNGLRFTLEMQVE